MRVIPRQSAAGITAELFKRLAGFQEALILVIQPPPVAGIGNAGGVRMMVEDRAAPRLAGIAGSDHRDGHQGVGDAWI